MAYTRARWSVLSLICARILALCVQLSDSRHRRVGGFAVRVQVEAHFFGFVGNADAVANLVRQLEADPGRGGGVHGGADGGKDLNGGLLEHRHIVEATQSRGGEDTEQDGTQESADAVDAKDIERVVVAKLFLDSRREESADDGGAETHQHGTNRADEAGRRGDGGETSDGGGARAENGDFAVFNDIPRGPHHGGDGGGELRREARKRGTRGGSARRATVEAEPADPKHGGTEEGEHQVALMNLRILARAEVHGRDEGADTGGDVHDNATSKVKNAHVSEEGASAAPDHVARREVHGKHPERAEPHDGVELHAFDERANHERRGDDGESHLIQDPEGFRDGARDGSHAHTGEANLVETTDEGRERRDALRHADAAKGQRVAAQEPQEGHVRREREALNQHAQGVVTSHQTGVEGSQTRNGHEEHERRGNQNPARIRGDNRRNRRGGRGRRSRERHRRESSRARNERLFKLSKSLDRRNRRTGRDDTRGAIDTRGSVFKRRVRVDRFAERLTSRADRAGRRRTPPARRRSDG